MGPIVAVPLVAFLAAGCVLSAPPVAAPVAPVATPSVSIEPTPTPTLPPTPTPSPTRSPAPTPVPATPTAVPATTITDAGAQLRRQHARVADRGSAHRPALHD